MGRGIALVHDQRFKPGMKVAVVGTGIAGMSAAWLLNRVHNVTVYEQDVRVGGHSNTVDVPVGDKLIPVDTGFIVYNEQNYPNLTALFHHLAVPTKLSSMSFAVSLRGGHMEYCASDLNGLLAQRRNMLHPRFWRMVIDILRFYRERPSPRGWFHDETKTLGDFLKAGRYSQAFVQDHLLPIGAAIWSTSADQIKDYPARAFIDFFRNHGLLTVRQQLAWRTVDGGSREYVRRLTSSYADRVRFGGVQTVRPQEKGVEVIDSRGQRDTFDQVVLATHADQALKLIADADSLERSLLDPWRYTMNRAVLHSDARFMPKLKKIWSSWNFIETTSAAKEGSLCVSYWLNRLQTLAVNRPLFVTLNPSCPPDPTSIVDEFDYTHPCFDVQALAAQKKLGSLQGHRRLWYCGSYFGYGFHEDALRSGLTVAEALGSPPRPWTLPRGERRAETVRGGEINP